MYDYFDIHSHLHFKDFDVDREEVVSEMKKKNIATISVGVNFDTSQKEVELAQNHENIFACIGQHPDDSKEDVAFDERLIELAGNSKVVAIGECGLDYFRLAGDVEKSKDDQKEKFLSHMDLAIKFEKPLMLHVRPSKGSQDAYVDTLNILEHHIKTSADKLHGNSHFFVGDLNTLKRFLNIGFSVSFTGVVTFTRDYDELIKFAPIDMIMAETDAPFVAPVPYRGTRNSPLYVTEVVKKIAEIRGEPLEKVKTALVNNALRHFNI